MNYIERDYYGRMLYLPIDHPDQDDDQPDDDQPDDDQPDDDQPDDDQPAAGAAIDGATK
jgi:hypothetical protein